jgi:chemotaxis protein methyltransferase CheR
MRSSPCPFGEADYESFQKSVQRRIGIHLCDYKSDQMRRRLTTLCQQAKCDSFGQYFAALERDSSLLSEFLDRTTINVTELLRNPERFADLSKVILPDLLARRKGAPLSVWSAGCSYGAEAYTVAMLLQETAPGLAHRIQGTDVDLAVLAKAASPSFTEADMANISPLRRQTCFQGLGNGVSLPNSALRTMVQFGRHDLLADPYPRAEYDLILCRNVLIYFNDDAKERIYRGFHQALRPGGVLFVGGTERLSDHRALGFELLLPFFYRKPD